MNLPNANHAIIDVEKLTRYVLSEEHDEGKHKAKLFRDVLGITVENANLLADGLREAIAHEEATVGRLDLHGQRYTVDFRLSGPKGGASVRSAWIIRIGEAFPRFVTCYLL